MSHDHSYRCVIKFWYCRSHVRGIYNVYIYIYIYRPSIPQFTILSSNLPSHHAWRAIDLRRLIRQALHFLLYLRLDIFIYPIIVCENNDVEKALRETKILQKIIDLLISKLSFLVQNYCEMLWWCVLYWFWILQRRSY